MPQKKKKRQEAIIHNEEIKQSTTTNLELTQMLELVDKDTTIIITKFLKTVIELLELKNTE